MFVISRIETYKFSDAAAVYAESERTLTRYDNPDWHPERVKDNVHLIAPLVESGIEKHILDRKKEFGCRLSIDSSLPLNKQTNCFCQAYFGASPEFFQGLTKKQTDDFFERALKYFSSSFPSVEIISAVIHYDETTPHMHVNFLPIMRKQNNRGKWKTVFCSSDLFDGKDFFTKYQDNYYEFMKSHYPELPLERKGEEHQDHLSVKEFKQVQADIARAKEELQQIEEIKKEAIGSNTPLIDAKIANAELKRKNQLLEKENDELRRSVVNFHKFVDYLASKFPALKPLVDYYYSLKAKDQRGKFEKKER